MNVGEILNLSHEEAEHEISRLHAIIKECIYKEDTGLKVINIPPYGVVAQTVSQQINHETDQKDMLLGPKCFIEVGLSEDKIVMEIYRLWRWWEDHECAESFKYKGIRVYDPHEQGRNL